MYTNVHIISWVVECFYRVTALQVSDEDNGQKVLWQVKVHLIQLGATGEAEAVQWCLYHPLFFRRKFLVAYRSLHMPSASGHCSSRVEGWHKMGASLIWPAWKVCTPRTFLCHRPIGMTCSDRHPWSWITALCRSSFLLRGWEIKGGNIRHICLWADIMIEKASTGGFEDPSCFLT